MTNANVRTMEQHARAISATWLKAVRSIVETGKRLREAQEELDHGEWGRMFNAKKVPFSIRTAQHLMEIAEHPVLENAQHVAHLPPHWGTLSELAALSESEALACITSGKIHPEMTRAEAKALRPSNRSAHQQRPELDPNLADLVQLGEVLICDLRNGRRVAPEQVYELAEKLKALGDRLSGGVEMAAAPQLLN